MSGVELLGVLRAADADGLETCLVCWESALALLAQPEAQPLPSLQRHRLIATVAETRPFVPVRRGASFADAAAALAWARGNSGRLHALIERLEGRAELSLSLFEAGGAAGEPASGEGYLRLQAERVRAAEERMQRLKEQGAALSACLAGAAEQQRLESWCGPNGACGLDLSLLVQRSAFGELRVEAERAVAASGQPWRVSGPWPPYSFADLRA